ncbi:MAG: hypothetical protein MUC28_03885 [Planctomycetes bacterium]|jgi:NADH:ubiquinone oxidoreductase subunit F (NADH-binding)|nr:hypothetical protein [Planctomycetota bacterium]
MAKDIITKLKNSVLTGRGGACYPTWLKWTAVKAADGEKKYVVANGSEGEPGVRKDHHILENHPERIVEGIDIALRYLKADKAYIYLNPVYYHNFKARLMPLTKNKPIEIISKSHSAGYIGGEETSALNSIEGRRVEPRLRPPFPPTHGLRGAPTLINNIETFYAVSLIATDEYDHQRFYTINGDCLWTGVYELRDDWTIEKVLKETDNYPDFEFFVQVGGEASGEVLNSRQLKQPAGGSGAITVYSVYKHEPLDLIRRWAGFFAGESCGQCTPCREGTYRLRELLAAPEPNWPLIAEILDTLRDTSFCGLGCAAPVAIESYIRNVLSTIADNKIKLPSGVKHTICECFK